MNAIQSPARSDLLKLKISAAPASLVDKQLLQMFRNYIFAGFHTTPPKVVEKEFVLPRYKEWKLEIV